MQNVKFLSFQKPSSDWLLNLFDLIDLLNADGHRWNASFSMLNSRTIWRGLLDSLLLNEWRAVGVWKHPYLVVVNPRVRLIAHYLLDRGVLLQKSFLSLEILSNNHVLFPLRNSLLKSHVSKNTLHNVMVFTIKGRFEQWVLLVFRVTQWLLFLLLVN